MYQIEITGATGTGPYDIYVCDYTLTYCVLAGSGISFPPNFLYTLVYPLDIVSSVMVKMIDSNGCEFLHLYNCPTATPTPTPTLTPTTTPSECRCIQFENISPSSVNIEYIQCDGNYFYGSVPALTTIYVCGNSPFAEDGVVFDISLPCTEGACNPIPPPPSATPTQTPTPTLTPTITPTQTITPTITPTLTPTPSPAIPCQSIYTDGADLYVYDFITDTSTSIYSAFVTLFSDIAFTTTKLWRTTSVQLEEWDIISTTPYTLAFNRNITIPTVTSSSIMAINNLTLLTARTSINPNRIIELDITTSPAVVVPLFNTIPNRTVQLDIILTTTNKVIVTSEEFGTNNWYITQYSYPTGVMEVDILLSPTIVDVGTIFMNGGGIYILEQTINQVWKIDKTAPYNITLVGSGINLGVLGGSQLLSCFDTNFE